MTVRRREAFIVWLVEDGDRGSAPDAYRGYAEHAASGARATFRNTAELLRFFRETLGATPEAPSAEGS
jgi:hypothetical protein